MDILNQHLLHAKGIYRIINKVNGKYYIGMTTTSFRKRYHQHKNKLRGNKHPNTYLQESYNKYSEVNFVFECYIDMTYFSKEEILAKEESLITQDYKSGLLYNAALGILRIKRDQDSLYLRNFAGEAWRICKLDKKNNLLKTYTSAKHAEKETGHSSSKISYSAKYLKECSGPFNWAYEKDYLNNKNLVFEPMKIKMRLDCSIYQINNGIIINKFDTVKQASEKTDSNYNAIRACTKNKRKTCSKGFQWIFKEDYDTKFHISLE